MASDHRKKKDDYKASNADEYTNGALWLYDFILLKLIARFVWRCPTSQYTLPLFRANASTRHMDVGVATGYFTAKHDWPKGSEVTLCDLNTNCLEKAKERLRQRPDVSCRTLHHDILEPLPKPTRDMAGGGGGMMFDSISMLYLLHCLPQPTHRKTAVFKHIKHNLSANGTIFGATVLGERRFHTRFSYWWLIKSNEGPFLDNMEDTEKEFIDALYENFEEVETSIVGSIFIFRAKNPIR